MTLYQLYNDCSLRVLIGSATYWKPYLLPEVHISQGGVIEWGIRVNA